MPQIIGDARVFTAALTARRMVKQTREVKPFDGVRRVSGAT
jgi:hypothetical protein